MAEASLVPAVKSPAGVTWSSGGYGGKKPPAVLEKGSRIVKAEGDELDMYWAYLQENNQAPSYRPSAVDLRRRLNRDERYKSALTRYNTANKKEAAKAAAKERAYLRGKADKESAEVRKSFQALSKEVNAMVKDQSEELPGNFYEMKPDEKRAWKNKWIRDTYANRRALGNEAIAALDAGKPKTQRAVTQPTTTERPPGKVVKGKKGDVILSPTGEMNGKTAYDVYKQNKSSGSWEKKGISLGEGSTGFIPENKMGTSKMRMDTFKSAYNKYKRDMKITGGEEGLGGESVNARMEKDWGEDWKETYLNDGKVQQMYWDKNGKPTDVAPGEEVVEEDDPMGDFGILPDPDDISPSEQKNYDIWDTFSPMAPKYQMSDTNRKLESVRKYGAERTKNGPGISFWPKGSQPLWGGEDTPVDPETVRDVYEPPPSTRMDKETLVGGNRTPMMPQAKIEQKYAIGFEDEGLTPEEEEELLRLEEEEELRRAEASRMNQYALQERSGQWFGGSVAPEYYME
jgi:hypothetical protein